MMGFPVCRVSCVWRTEMYRYVEFARRPSCMRAQGSTLLAVNGEAIRRTRICNPRTKPGSTGKVMWCGGAGVEAVEAKNLLVAEEAIA